MKSLFKSFSAGRFFVIFSFSIAAVLFFSCNKDAVKSIKSEDLFSLSYGKMDNQLDLFDLSSPGQINTSLTMKDGFFYISNGESKKILEFNSYGDLLSLYYNKDSNVTPDFDVSSDTAGSTLKAVEYPFNTPNHMTVDGRKYLYAADTLPSDRIEHDKENGLLLSQVVLRFSSDGKYIDYLGQQGPGGTPFPFIENIQALDNNELVVICVTNEGRTVYWFSSSGYLLYTIPIGTEDVPNPFKDKTENEMYISIDSIYPDYHARKLYIEVDYYTSVIDEASKVQSGIDYTSTLIYPLNAATGTYDEPIHIPPYHETETDGFSKISYDIPYQFIGVDGSGWFFFMLSTKGGYSVQMVSMNGQKILKRRIEMDSTTDYYVFSLSEGGILSALFADDSDVKIKWWRTDILLKELLKS